MLILVFIIIKNSLKINKIIKTLYTCLFNISLSYIKYKILFCPSKITTDINQRPRVNLILLTCFGRERSFCWFLGSKIYDHDPDLIVKQIPLNAFANARALHFRANSTYVSYEIYLAFVDIPRYLLYFLKASFMRARPWTSADILKSHSHLNTFLLFPYNEQKRNIFCSLKNSLFFLFTYIWDIKFKFLLFEMRKKCSPGIIRGWVDHRAHVNYM